jgi:hypothetical protein
VARVCFTQNLARHVRCPDADAAGATVREVTGNLWLTENQGDDWRQLSAHLPPIHAVRFV